MRLTGSTTTARSAGFTGCASCVLVLCVCVGGARSDDDVPSLLFPDSDDVATLSVGAPVRLVGKYAGLVEDHLHLWETPLELHVSSDALKRRLLGFSPNVDNVVVHGSLSSRPTGPKELPVFEVTGVDGTGDDKELLTKELKALFARSGRTSDDVLRVAQTIFRVRGLDSSDDLVPLLTKAVFEGYRLAELSIDPNDVAARVALIDRIHTLVPDSRVTTELMIKESRRFPDNAALASRLERLGNRKVDGQWLDPMEFKRHEGFVTFKGVWMKPADREFFEVLEALSHKNLTNLILRSKTDRHYAQLAHDGRVGRGMRFEEVAIALGFPDRVRRRRLGSLEVDQWDYGDQRVYFLNDQVYSDEGDSSLLDEE